MTRAAYCRFFYLKALLFLGLLLTALGPIHAQDAVPLTGNGGVSTEASPASGSAGTSGMFTAPVLVGDRKILEVASDSAQEAKARSERVILRLEKLVQREEAVATFTESDLTAAPDGQPAITLGGEPILTVTPLDAEQNLTASRDLALMWGGKLSVAVAEARNAQANPLRGIAYLVRYSVRDLVVSISTLLPRLVGAVLVWLVFMGLARFVRFLTKLATERMPLDGNQRQLARAVAFYGVWAAGLVTILSTLGIDSTSIATAVGISGFVLGFAFKDILSHFFAGLMLLMSRQLQIGGQIVVGEFEGTVEKIELRALQLRTPDNRLVIIPNGDVFTSAIISNTSNLTRRREFFVGIGYEQDLLRAQRVALEALSSTEGVLTTPEPMVLVQELGSYAVSLRVLFSVHSQDARVLHIRSECIRRVKEAFDRENITMPSIHPTVTVEEAEALTPV